MRVVLWIGNEANQKALTNRIAEQHDVVGIVNESRVNNSKSSLKVLLHKVISRLFLTSLRNSWTGMHQFYDKKYPDFPMVSTLDCENINSDEAYAFTKNLNPDLIVVSGTKLIKDKMLSIKPSKGLLNLHTGLSPYIKGGPNCTNWCISTKQYHLIGNTIMWIDSGIDTGNIVSTELTEFKGDERLLDIHIKVMEHAHKLYLDAIMFIKNGGSSNVQQNSIAEGKTYYTSQWDLKAKFRLAKNIKDFQKNINSKKVSELKFKVQTIILPST